VINLPIYRRENGKLESVPGNYAILDENGLMPENTIPLSGIKYFNHNGDVTNFLDIPLLGNGSATENIAEHKMDLDSGAITGYAAYQSKNVLPISNLKASFKITDFLPQTLGQLKLFNFGIYSAVENLPDGIYFSYNADIPAGVLWIKSGVNNETQGMSISDDDVFHFITNGVSHKIYQNRTLVKTSNLSLTGNFYVGAYVKVPWPGAFITDSMKVSIDYINIETME